MQPTLPHSVGVPHQIPWLRLAADPPQPRGACAIPASKQGVTSGNCMIFCELRGDRTQPDRLKWFSRVDSARQTRRSRLTGGWNVCASPFLSAVSEPKTPPVHPLMRSSWGFTPRANNAVGLHRQVPRLKSTQPRNSPTSPPLKSQLQNRVLPLDKPLVQAPLVGLTLPGRIKMRAP